MSEDGHYALLQNVDVILSGFTYHVDMSECQGLVLCTSTIHPTTCLQVFVVQKCSISFSGKKNHTDITHR